MIPGICKINAPLPVIALLALRHLMFALFFVKNAGPLADALQDRDNRPAFLGQRILHSRRDLIVRFPVDDPVFEQIL